MIKNRFDKGLKRLKNKFIIPHTADLINAVDDCETFLDLGCWKDSPLKHVTNRGYSVGVDLYKTYIKESKEKKIHDKYYCMNVLDAFKKFGENSFDCVLALSLIEHLNRKDGLKLLKNMEKIARKKVVVLTPNGFIPNDDFDGNDLQNHLSGWTVKDFKKRNYNIIGAAGFKYLRINHKLFWTLISPLTILSKYFPRMAYQLLAVKTIKK